jgi:galactose-1-phosphate uridylyltransferase
MKFVAYQKKTVILNPLKDMAPKEIPVEIRVDPLTGRTARICHFMKLQWDKPDLQALVAGTEEKCPFCPGRVMKVTPCFSEDLVPDGRITLDDLVLFPNLAPYDQIGAVAVLGSRHYIPMTEIEPKRIAKGFALAMKFFRTIHQNSHPESVYHIASWNYMPPAGSSIIHPHLQVFVTSNAPNLLREELRSAETYTEKYGSNYWDDLVDYEIKEGKRYLGSIGRTVWLTTYAPLGVAGDVMGVVRGVRSTLALSDEDLFHLALGLSKIMAAYDEMGIYSFNVNFFTGRVDDDFARFHILFSPRTYFNPALGTPDVAALRNLFNESVCMTFPEEINTKLKTYF